MVASVDLGSNNERFWYWIRCGEPPAVFTVAYRDVDLVQRYLEIPFKPDWLMEVLGVTPLRGRMRLYPEAPGSNLVNLVSEHETAGQHMRRVIKVDRRSGQAVQHQLFDSEGRKVAQARLSHYKQTGDVQLARRIQLEWPQTKSSMTIRIGDVDVNTELAESLWELPDKQCNVVDLGEKLRHSKGLPHHTPDGHRPSREPRIGETPESGGADDPFPDFKSSNDVSFQTLTEPGTPFIEDPSLDREEKVDEPPWSNRSAADGPATQVESVRLDSPFAPFE